MANIDDLKRAKREAKKQKESLIKRPSSSKEEDKKQFDFRGLPDRQFKKNLGCG